jgi:hypothetical protein
LTPATNPWLMEADGSTLAADSVDENRHAILLAA